MNPYEQKQAEKKARYEARAEKARMEASARFGAADLREENSGIPMGQPILVGHHSEKKHRRALERADSNFRKGIEAEQRAETYERRAANMGSAISSDDPEAVTKLLAKIEVAESRQNLMKKANKAARKKGATAESVAKALKIDTEAAARILTPNTFGDIGFARFELTNNNANIRRMKQRVEQLRREAATVEAEPIEGNGYQLIESKKDNRIRFIFDGKPSAQIRTFLKRFGFKWAPSIGAWQRQLNGAGRSAAEQVVNILEGSDA